MRQIETSLGQRIYNLCNTKQDFTHSLTKHKGRYIVSCKNVLSTENMSFEADGITKVFNALKSTEFDSLGGWLDKETEVYHLDLNSHFYNLDIALQVGYLNEQKAIFDTLENKVIYL